LGDESARFLSQSAINATLGHYPLLRIAAPYFPGWEAEVDGRAVNLVPVDVALMGPMVPAGDRELMVRYRSTRFAAGTAISGVAWLAAIFWLWWGFRRRARPYR
jgi:uncharacterized membrane protein YfhO